MDQAAFTFSQPPIVAIAEPEMGTVPPIRTVSELVRAARGLLEGEFGDVWVVGEVSGFRAAASGHCYFDLKDDNSLLPVVCFRPVAHHLRFRIDNGLELVCHGRLSIFEKGGKFQIIVDHCEPKGVGALQLAFEQLKARLAAEGLFDARHKQPLPFLPRRIGVVTSPTGAAIRDILHIVQRRFPGIDILLAPARVQGEGAADEIAAAIALLDTQGICDVVIVGRGGGSLEDLWAFNEEVVARAIFAARTPIVSAVGHEIDFTIADFVADLRAPTPSAAAELVVPLRAELVATIEERRAQLTVALRRAMELKSRAWQEWAARLKPPTTRLSDWLLQIDQCRERLIFAVRTGMDRRHARWEQLAAELSHLSPLAVLAKGYAVVRKAGDTAPVKRAADIRTGDRVDIRFADGSANAVIQ